MARSNRVSVPDGIYHVTSRIVNRNHWFSDSKFKDMIVSWLYGIAAFSGIHLLDWCILDNHFHLFVYVPSVPDRYHISSQIDRLATDIDHLSPLNANLSSCRIQPPDPPQTENFTMRPSECNSPRWIPDSLSDILKRGQSPASNNLAFPRPPTGFMLSDEEMSERLSHLYGDPKRAAAILKSWKKMRKIGNGAAVDAEKDRYCRRMYNITQFVKTFKERISQAIRKMYGHEGHVFEGRFYSGLVQKEDCVKELVSLYISYNPYKAGLVKVGESYRWSAYGEACSGGEHCESCRAAFAELFGGTWEEVRKVIDAAFQEKVAQDPNWQQSVRKGTVKVSPGQLIRLSLKVISCGAFIGKDVLFGQEVLARYDKKFPGPSIKSLRWLATAVDWPDSRRRAS